ncbi:MAG TPA: hypothetical protein VIQ31_34625 [Phormidium sp.]
MIHLSFYHAQLPIKKSVPVSATTSVGKSLVKASSGKQNLKNFLGTLLCFSATFSAKAQQRTFLNVPVA